jgi:hypothetical protein
MAKNTIKFSAIPSAPQAGVDPWQFAAISALKENVEIMVGARGDQPGRALFKGQIGVVAAPNQNMRQVTARGAGYTISDVTVPSIDDYVTLLGNVQTLANDVAAIRETLNTLINQLKA